MTPNLALQRPPRAVAPAGHAPVVLDRPVRSTLAFGHFSFASMSMNRRVRPYKGRQIGHTNRVRVSVPRSAARRRRVRLIVL